MDGRCDRPSDWERIGRSMESLSPEGRRALFRMGMDLAEEDWSMLVGGLRRLIERNDAEVGELRSALAEAERLRVAAIRLERLIRAAITGAGNEAEGLRAELEGEEGTLASIRAARLRRDGQDGAALAEQERAERKWLVASEMDVARLAREGRPREAEEAEERTTEQWRRLASIRTRGDAARKEELPAGARDRLRGMWRDRPGR